LEGGHNIPEKDIRRRYYSGLKNLFEIYIPICDYWILFNNSVSPSELIAEGYKDKDLEIKNFSNFTIIKKLAGHDKK
jgi:predicted ABC-type ATPase